VTVKVGAIVGRSLVRASIVVAGPRCFRRGQIQFGSPLALRDRDRGDFIRPNTPALSAASQRSLAALGKASWSARLMSYVPAGDIMPVFRAWIRRRSGALLLGVLQSASRCGVHRRRLLREECGFRLGITKGRTGPCFRHAGQIARSCAALTAGARTDRHPITGGTRRLNRCTGHIDRPSPPSSAAQRCHVYGCPSPA